MTEPVKQTHMARLMHVVKLREGGLTYKQVAQKTPFVPSLGITPSKDGNITPSRARQLFLKAEKLGLVTREA